MGGIGHFHLGPTGHAADFTLYSIFRLTPRLSSLYLRPMLESCRKAFHDQVLEVARFVGPARPPPQDARLHRCCRGGAANTCVPVRPMCHQGRAANACASASTAAAGNVDGVTALGAIPVAESDASERKPRQAPEEEQRKCACYATLSSGATRLPASGNDRPL
jgi:hypothetical protein